MEGLWKVGFLLTKRKFPTKEFPFLFAEVSGKPLSCHLPVPSVSLLPPIGYVNRISPNIIDKKGK